MLGRTISHYRVIERLGGGAMGVVYKAHDLHLDRPVALKFLPPQLSVDEADKIRFIREAKAVSALDHPHICTIYDVDETDDGQLFMALAFYDGETLKKKIERGPLSVGESVVTAIQIAEGLAEAHRHEIIHRDIKPANVMVIDDSRVKILDFGLAKLVGDSAITRKGTTVGTTAYMSPEQLRGEQVDGRSDIWSLGVMLYEMVSGQRPFRADYEPAVSYSILNETPEPLSSASREATAELEAIVSRILSKDAAARYQTADELAADLRRFHGVSSGEILPRPPRTRLGSRGTLGRVLAAAGLLTVLGAGGFWLWQSLDRGEAPPPIRSAAAQELFDQARAREGQGDSRSNLEEAEDRYRRALSLEPENAHLQASLAALLARIQLQYPEPGRVEEILSLVDSALQADRKLLPAWMARGQVSLMEADYETAASSADRAIEAAPEDYCGYALKGEVLVLQGRIDEGMELLRQSLAKEGGRVWGRLKLAKQLSRQGKLDEAAGHYLRVLEYQSDQVNALNNLAAVYMKTGRESDAVPYLRRLLQLDPSDDAAASNLGTIYFNWGRLEDAIELYEKAHEWAPQDPHYPFNIAEAYDKLEQADLARRWYGSAFEAYNRAIAAEGYLSELLAQRAVCSAKLGRFDEAIADVEEALNLAPGETLGLFRAAQVFALAEEKDLALSYIESGLRAGLSREQFLTDPAFEAYREDSEFQALLESGLDL